MDAIDKEQIRQHIKVQTSIKLNKLRAMENLIELLQNNKELRKQARQLIALAVGEMAEKRNNVSFDGWFNKNVREAKTSDESGGLNKSVVNQQRELLLAFCDHLNTYAGMEEIRFDFMMQDFIDKSQ